MIPAFFVILKNAGTQFSFTLLPLFFIYNKEAGFRSRRFHRLKNDFSQ